MNTPNFNAAALLRIEEQIRQERETFDQRKEQEAKWFSLRLRMGYAAVILLPAIIIISTYILFNHTSFTFTIVTAASGALFADVIGLIVAVWKVVLNPGSVTKLEPIISNGLNGFPVEEAEN
jgi:hypothetical protein